MKRSSEVEIVDLDIGKSVVKLVDKMQDVPGFHSAGHIYCHIE